MISIQSKLIYKFNTIPIKIQGGIFFLEMQYIYSNIYTENRGHKKISKPQKRKI